MQIAENIADNGAHRGLLRCSAPASVDRDPGQGFEGRGERAERLGR